MAGSFSWSHSGTFPRFPHNARQVTSLSQRLPSKRVDPASFIPTTINTSLTSWCSLGQVLYNRLQNFIAFSRSLHNLPSDRLECTRQRRSRAFWRCAVWSFRCRHLYSRKCLRKKLPERTSSSGAETHAHDTVDIFQSVFLAPLLESMMQRDLKARPTASQAIAAVWNIVLQ